MEAVGDLGVLGAGGVEFGHAAGQVFLLVFEGAQVGEDGHAFGEDGAAGKREAFLGQVAEGDALLGDDGAGVEAFDAGEHLEQGRFAGAVGAHDAGALVGRDQPVDVFEENFGAVVFAGPGELDHGGFRLYFSGARRSGCEGKATREGRKSETERRLAEIEQGGADRRYASRRLRRRPRRLGDGERMGGWNSARGDGV